MIPSLDKTISIVSQQESRDSNIFGRVSKEQERRTWGQTAWTVSQFFTEMQTSCCTFPPPDSALRSSAKKL